jgi:hypothetical protein
VPEARPTATETANAISGDQRGIKVGRLNSRATP